MKKSVKTASGGATQAKVREVPYPGVSLVALDAVAVATIYILVSIMRHSHAIQDNWYPEVILFMTGINWLFLGLVGGYDSHADHFSLRYSAEHLIATLVAGVVGPLLIYSVGTYWDIIKPSRIVVLSTAMLFPLVSLGYRRLLFKGRYSELTSRSLILIGANLAAQQLYKYLKHTNWPNTIHCYTLEPSMAGQNLIPGDPESPKLSYGLKADLNDDTLNIDTIVLALNPENIDSDFLHTLFDQYYRGVKVQTLNSFSVNSLQLVPLSEVNPQWVFDAEVRLRDSFIFARIKRLLDIGLSCFGLLLGSPIGLITAVLVRLETPGPAIFKQQRIGRGGVPFTLFKFRSMGVGSDKGNAYTQKEDARITRLGSIIRKYRIDEWPQLYNVLRGDMSFIGPRAEWDKLVATYEQSIPYYRIRHMVKPGITGWAQVNYPYGASLEDTKEKLKYDLYYVRYYSFLLDLSILLKTVYTILRAGGR